MVSRIIKLANFVYIKDISEKGAKKTNTTKRSIISLISSAELIKLERMIKFHD